MRGKRAPFVLLALLLLSACATKTGPSSYRITIPTLTIFPKSHTCWLHDRKTGQHEPANCVTLLEDDYFAIIAELKAACLAAGQEPEQCQTLR
jgi:hypothetical protein